MINRSTEGPFVLCRRDLADFGASAAYCNKPIKRRNALNWCEDCRKRFPFWPPNDEPAPAAAAPTASAPQDQDPNDLLQRGEHRLIGRSPETVTQGDANE